MMFDFDTVMEKITYASKSEGGYVDSFIDSANSFVLKDSMAGEFRVTVEPEKVYIDALDRENWHHVATSMDGVFEFINVVIYDIDPYLD